MSQSVAAPGRAAGSIPATLRGATLAFASGCLGGLTNSLAVWLFGALGVFGKSRGMR